MFQPHLVGPPGLMEGVPSSEWYVLGISPGLTLSSGASTTIFPRSSSIGAVSSPTRILGPERSTMIPTSQPTWMAASRTKPMAAR